MNNYTFCQDIQDVCNKHGVQSFFAVLNINESITEVIQINCDKDYIIKEINNTVVAALQKLDPANGMDVFYFKN